MARTRLEELVFRLSADSRDLRRELGLAERRGERSARQLRNSFSRIQPVFGSLRRQVLGLGAAFAAVFGVRAIGRFAQDALQASAAFEQYGVRLAGLLGDQAEANEALERFITLSERTPFAVADIVEGASTLGAAAIGNRERLEELTETAANLAAVTGLSFQEAASNLQRALSAGIGAADLFRERGVRALIESVQGIPDATKLSLDELEAAFRNVFGAGGVFGNAADELSNTLGGALSNIGDAATNLKVALGDALGPTVVNTARQVLIPFLHDLQQAVENNQVRIREFAVDGIGGVLRAFRGFLQGGRFVLDALDDMRRLAFEAADGWLRLQLAITRLQVKGERLREQLGFGSPEETERFRQQAYEIRQAIVDLRESASGGGFQDYADGVAAIEAALASLEQRLESADLNAPLPERKTAGVSSIGGGPSRTEVALRSSREDIQLEIEQQRRLIDALNVSQEAYNDVAAAIEAENEVRAAGLDLYSAEGIQLYKLVALREKQAQQIAQLKKDSEDSFAGIKQAGEDAAQGLSQAFADFALEGELSLDRIGRAFARNILQNELQSLFTSALGLTPGTSILGGILGAGKAHGGRTMPGRVYPVGEQGPELFVPDVAGQVVNFTKAASAASGGGDVHVQIVNTASSEVSVTAERTGPTERDLRILVARTVNDNIRNGAHDAALSRRFGARPIGV